MLETILIVILLFIVGVPISINAIGPFIVWKTQKLPAIVKIQTLKDDEFLENRNDEFSEYDQSLVKLGFFSVGSSLLKDSNTDSHFRLYWHNEIKVAAMVVIIKSKAEEIGLVKKEIDAEGKRPLTLQGAIALTYRSISPGKNILGFITEERAEAALKNA